MTVEKSKQVVKYVKENNIRIGTILRREQQYFMVADIEVSDNQKLLLSIIRVQRAIFPKPHFKILDNDLWYLKNIDIDAVFFQINLCTITDFEVVGYDIDLHKRGMKYGWSSSMYMRIEEHFNYYLDVLSTLEDGVYYIGNNYKNHYLYIMFKTGVEDILSTEVLTVSLDDLNVDLSQINAPEMIEKILTEDINKMSLVTLKDIKIYNLKKIGKVRDSFDFSTYALKVRMLCAR